MPLVRTKFRLTPFRMTDEEAADLGRQGLVVEVVAEPEPPADDDSGEPDPPPAADPVPPKSTAKPAKEPK
jgi:hypothetical protein